MFIVLFHSLLHYSVKKMAKKGIVSTGAKGLRCRAIVHVNISHFNDWKAVISMCLSEAENIPGVTSIAFPALGTGKVNSITGWISHCYCNMNCL